MTAPTPDTAYSAWLAQMSDPKVWQTWLQTATQAATQAAPITASTQPPPNLEELGVTFDPVALRSLQQDYMQQFSQLWSDALVAKAPVVADKRFAAVAWQSNPLFAFNAATYLLNAHFLGALVDAVQAPSKLKRKIRFAVQQMIDAASPANFLATNPEAQQKIIESKGESLSKGVARLFADMQKGRISQTDETAFEVGKSVATSEGAVVFENDLFQLIQYKPMTSKV
ncbi:MAG: class I poly(R)-hydroxyalkanoic acid synthase, partial [Herbaspirillum sp.]